MPHAPQTIVVIEDEASIAETIVYALQTEGFAAVWKSTGAEGIAAVQQDDKVLLVVLDVGLPDISGFEVCRRIHAHRNVPVIFLTARSAEVDRIVGLELGADDYVQKPFSPRELTARVRAVLRRARPDRAVVVENASEPARSASVWVHDDARCCFSYRGRKLELTRNEYRLLLTLLRRPGAVLSREQLLAAAWEDPGAALDRTVDAHIKTLRAKLRDAAPTQDPIVTHRGFGYSVREE